MIYCSYSHMLIDYVSSDEERGHTVTRMSRLPGNISVKTRNMQYAVFIGFYKTLKGQNACAPSQGIKTILLTSIFHKSGQNACAPSQGIKTGSFANIGRSQ